MRSYYAHLKTPDSVKKGYAKPTYRSSAIFPVINQPGISSRILFMGYWILKRNIKEISQVVTLRSEDGKILHRTNQIITEPKTYRIELKDYLAGAHIPEDTQFTGSLEVEFFSSQNFVFPFPATVINYYGPGFSSVVHTAQRIYNDYEDMLTNSQTAVPESGFNVYADDQHEPFFGLINGPLEVPEETIRMTFYNEKKETLTHELNLGSLAPYAMRMVYPARHVDLKAFLGGKVGAGKIQFKVNWAYPRLIVGNMDRSIPSLHITHTYYDCSNAKTDEDYWFAPEEGWYPASLMVPVSLQETRFTNVYFYPIYSPSTFDIDVEIYNSEGKLLGSQKNFLRIVSPKEVTQTINFKPLCQKLGIDTNQDLAARLIAQAPEGQTIPSRIKIGFDLGHEKHLPCNICTNLQPFNPALESKPSTFRWSPVLTNERSPSLWLLNSSPKIHYDRQAGVDLTFFREKDSETKTMKIVLPANGFKVIRPNDIPELRDFFEGKIGWMTAVANNPYTTTFYFVEHASGIVGGDHGF